ncbi:MAG: site-specific integrase [Acidimicrobiia bacterium]
MATIRQRRPGVWEVRAFTGRDDLGKPTQVSRTVRGGKKDAQRVAAELTVHPAPRARGRTVAELLDAYLELRGGERAEATKRDQRSRVRLVAEDPIGSVAVARLSVVDVDRWHVRLRKAGVGPGSIRNRHMVLRAALAQALRWGWVTTNVASLAPVSQPARAPRESMKAEDVRAVIDAATSFDPAAGLALRLAAVTGARRAELAAFRWDSVDGNRLTIDRSVAVIRHGRPDQRTTPTLVAAPTKTANRRMVTLDDDTLDLIAKVRTEREEFGPWMFAIGNLPANPDRIGNWWSRARRIAGIDEKWRLHDLRHWSATVAISGGHDVRTVAGRLGHANPAMTLRVYAHAVEAADQAVAVALGQALLGDAP